MKKITYSLLLVVATIFSSFGAAKVQFIHIDTTAGLSSFDMYVLSGTNVTFVDSFNYKTASVFLDVTHGNDLRLCFAPANSTGVGDTLPAGNLATTFNLTDGSNYYMIFNNGLFRLIGPFASTASGTTGEINLAFYHGAHGVPGVDVQARTSIGANLTLFDNVAPFTISPTLIQGLPTEAYDIRVADTSGLGRITSLKADLRSAGALPGGTSAIAFASGVLGATGTYAFGVFAALPINVTSTASQKATVVTLPLLNSALVQVIHASPDADSVQVYVDTDIMGLGGFVADSRVVPMLSPNALPFQGASRYLEVDWETDANAEVVVYDKDENNELFTKTFALTNNSAVVIVAAGELANFDLYPGAGRRFTDGGPGSGFLGTTVFHASPDAPEYDVRIVTPASVATDIATGVSYTEFSGYEEVPYVGSAFYVSQFSPTAGGATYRNNCSGCAFPLGLSTTANGAAFTLFLTGYVDPSANNNGPSLKICAASPNGNPVDIIGNLCYDLVVFTSVEEKIVNQMMMYPNPTNTHYNVEYTLESAQEVKYSVYNTIGQVVLSSNEGVQTAGKNIVNVDVANLSTGQYVIQMLIGNEVNVTRSFIKE